MELKELTFTIMGFILLHFQPLVKEKQRKYNFHRYM